MTYKYHARIMQVSCLVSILLTSPFVTKAGQLQQPLCLTSVVHGCELAQLLIKIHYGNLLCSKPTSTDYELNFTNQFLNLSNLYAACLMLKKGVKEMGEGRKEWCAFKNSCINDFFLRKSFVQYVILCNSHMTEPNYLDRKPTPWLFGCC